MPFKTMTTNTPTSPTTADYIREVVDHKGSPILEGVSVEQVRAENPNTAFPDVLSPTTMANLGIEAYERATPAGHDEIHTTLVESFTKETEASHWVQVLEVRELPAAVKAVNYSNALTGKVNEALDTYAKARGYSSMLHLVSYAGSSHEDWADEAREAINVRDAVWDEFHSVVSGLKSGGINRGPSWEGLLERLPGLE